VFPDCRLIVALRDPRDVCLSCFMQDFRLNSEMAHFLTLPDTARFYEVVMSFYLQLRPLIQVPHIEIRYEDTVADLTTQSQRLTEFLGVPWKKISCNFMSRHSSVKSPLRRMKRYANRLIVKRWRGGKDMRNISGMCCRIFSGLLMNLVMSSINNSDHIQQRAVLA